LVKIKASVAVWVAPTKTKPSSPNLSQAALVASNSLGDLILSADLPKKVKPPVLL
jgi:hypothetical protein